MKSGTRSTQQTRASWEEPSNFGLLCFNHMKANNVKKMLELGTDHGRDSIFFAYNRVEVDALDYSNRVRSSNNKALKYR